MRSSLLKDSSARNVGSAFRFKSQSCFSLGDLGVLM